MLQNCLYLSSGRFWRGAYHSTTVEKKSVWFVKKSIKHEVPISHYCSLWPYIITMACMHKGKPPKWLTRPTTKVTTRHTTILTTMYSGPESLWLLRSRLTTILTTFVCHPEPFWLLKYIHSGGGVSGWATPPPNIFYTSLRGAPPHSALVYLCSCGH
jgi:hypothetical protein